MVETFKQKFNKKFKQPLNKANGKDDIARLTGIPIKILDEIFDRGVGAFKTNPASVRPQVKSKEQWAMARVYAFVMKAYGGMKGKKKQDEDLYAKIKNKLK